MPVEMTMAWYIRLSDEDDDLRSAGKKESNSITNQRNLLREYYNSHEDLKQYEVIEFVDDGYTGTQFERPLFKAMMQMVQHRQVNCIMVKDLSRVGRDYLEVGAYAELIWPLFGIRFISVNEGFDSNNYVGTTGGVEIALRNLINSMYSRDLSAKVKSAKKTLWRQGAYLGGEPFYGYVKDPNNKRKLIIDPPAAEIVRRIYDECISGFTITKIAKKLNEDKVPSPSAYKKKKGNYTNGRIVDMELVWTPATVRSILINERYTGKLIANKTEPVSVGSKKRRSLPEEEWIVVENVHEAIISREIFERAAASRNSRLKTVNYNTKGNLRDRLFYCGYCGRKLQRSEGREKFLYCEKMKYTEESQCSCIWEPVEELEEKVFSVIKTLANILIEQKKMAKLAIKNDATKEKHKIATAKARLQRLQNDKLDLYEEYKNGKMTRTDFMSVYQSRQQEVDKLNAEIKRMENQYDTMRIDQQRLDKAAKDAKEISVLSEYSTTAIMRFVDKIRVFEHGKIEIDLKTNDGLIMNSLKQVVQDQNEKEE